MKEKKCRLPKWMRPWIPDSPLYLGILFMTLNAQLGMCDLVQFRLLENLLTASGMLILLYYALQGWPDVKSMLLCGIGYGIIHQQKVKVLHRLCHDASQCLFDIFLRIVHADGKGYFSPHISFSEPLSTLIVHHSYFENTSHLS